MLSVISVLLVFFFFLMIRRPPRSTLDRSSAASDVYKRQDLDNDGFIRQMRRYVGAGKGSAVIDTADKSGRLMRNVPMGQGDYIVSGEGIDLSLIHISEPTRPY